MSVFTALLLAHFIGDFYTQKMAWIECKIKNKHKSIGLFKHICVHLVLTACVLLVVAKNPLSDLVWATAAIVLSHYLIDIWKTYQTFTLFSFVADQIAHIVVITLVSIALSGMTFEEVNSIVMQYAQLHYFMLGAIYLFAFKPVSLLLYLMLKKYTEQLHDTPTATAGLSNAGEHIGYIERGLIITFLLLDSLTAVGFLLAAKSVFRFGDMRRESDRKLTEYIMLGTLLSFAFAIVLGKLAAHVASNIS